MAINIFFHAYLGTNITFKWQLNYNIIKSHNNNSLFISTGLTLWKTKQSDGWSIYIFMETRERDRDRERDYKYSCKKYETFERCQAIWHDSILCWQNEPNEDHLTLSFCLTARLTNGSKTL